MRLTKANAASAAVGAGAVLATGLLLGLRSPALQSQIAGKPSTPQGLSVFTPGETSIVRALGGSNNVLAGPAVIEAGPSDSADLFHWVATDGGPRNLYLTVQNAGGSTVRLFSNGPNPFDITIPKDESESVYFAIDSGEEIAFQGLGGGSGVRFVWVLRDGHPVSETTP